VTDLICDEYRQTELQLESAQANGFDADNEIMTAIQSTARCAPVPQEEFWVEVDDSVHTTLSEIAEKLTSGNRHNTLADTFMSHLAKILGGGLRTVW
jgi:hypothetical protein